MPHEASPPTEFRAQTIELFFDLVFVFVITRITQLVEHARGGADLLHAFSVLLLIWWMYGGYIWLTNHAHAPKSMRVVLILALAAFLVLALAIPQSNGDARLVFGLVYLFIVLLHYAAFAWHAGAATARAMAKIVVFNIAAAGLVIAAGLIGSHWSFLLLFGPALIYAYVSVRNTGEGFALNASHFVERHGLLLIIVLGETVIAIGTGLSARRINLRLVVDLCLSVALISALWWSYFDSDDRKAEHIMVHSDNRRRTRIAMFGYTGGHLVMIAGLILIAAGLRSATGAADGHGHDSYLLWGALAYVAGGTLFRGIAGIRPLRYRSVAALILAALAIFGNGLGETALIAVVLAVVAAVPALEGLAGGMDGERLNP